MRDSTRPWTVRSGHASLATALVLILGIVSGCQTSTVVTDFCLNDRPIYYSQYDTQETRDQIIDHNAVYDELCERKEWF